MKPLFFAAFVLFFCQQGFAQKQSYKVLVIGFYNLENFYDTTDNPLVNDDEFTPNGPRNYNSAIYWNKVGKLASVIAEIGTDTIRKRS